MTDDPKYPLLLTNKERPCKVCGAPVMTSVPGPEPTCIRCQDKEARTTGVQLTVSDSDFVGYELRVKKMRLQLTQDECEGAQRELNHEFGYPKGIICLLKLKSGEWFPIFDPIHARGIEAQTIVWVGKPPQEAIREISACLGLEHERGNRRWSLDRLLEISDKCLQTH